MDVKIHPEVLVDLEAADPEVKAEMEKVFEAFRQSAAISANEDEFNANVVKFLKEAGVEEVSFHKLAEGDFDEMEPETVKKIIERTENNPQIH